MIKTKSLIIGIILSLLLIHTNLEAQFTITKTAFEPVLGNKQTYYLGHSNTVVIDKKGTGLEWDYSTIRTPNVGRQSEVAVQYVRNTKNSKLSQNFLADSLTPISNNVKFNSFFDSNTSNTHIEGFYGKFPYNGSSTEATFVASSDNLKALYFPSSYGNSFTDNFSGKLYLSIYPFGGINMSGTSTYKINGYGKLKLPFNVEVDNVLQVIRRDSSKSDNIPFTSTNIELKVKDIQYYVSTSKFPVLRILEYEYNGSMSKLILSKHRLIEGVTGVVALTASPNDLKIYPNPINESNKQELSLYINNQKGIENISLNIFDISGKLIKSTLYPQINNGINLLNIAPSNPLAKGVYFISLSANSSTGTPLKSTRKVIVY